MSNRMWHKAINVVMALVLAVMLVPLFPPATPVAHAHPDVPAIETHEVSLVAAGTTCTITTPSGVQADDLLILVCTTDATGAALSGPSGWTVLLAENQSGGQTTASWYKISSGSEDPNYSVTWSGNEDAVGSITRISGVDTSDPIKETNTGTGSGNVVAPAVTTSVDDCLVFRFHGLDDDDQGDNYCGDLDAQHTCLYARGTATNWAECSGSVAYKTQLSVGDTGTCTWSVGGSEGWYAATVAIAPLAGPKTEQLHFRWRDDTTDLNSSGGWLNDAAEDSNDIGMLDKNTTIRLRMEAANTGADAESEARTYELQYEHDSTWTGIGDAADAFDMVGTTHIDPDGESATPGLLANSEGYTFVTGEGRDTADTTGSIGPLSASYYTELEYSFQATNSATAGNTYRFRLYDTTAAAPLDNYAVYPEVTIYQVPDVDQTHYRWRSDLETAFDGDVSKSDLTTLLNAYLETHNLDGKDRTGYDPYAYALAGEDKLQTESTAMALFYGDVDNLGLTSTQLQKIYNFFSYMEDSGWLFSDYTTAAGRTSKKFLHNAWSLGAIQILIDNGITDSDDLKTTLTNTLEAAIDVNGYITGGPENESDTLRFKAIQSLPFLLRAAQDLNDTGAIAAARRAVDFYMTNAIDAEYDLWRVNSSGSQISEASSHEAMEFSHGLYLFYEYETDNTRKNTIQTNLTNILGRYTGSVWSYTNTYGEKYISDMHASGTVNTLAQFQIRFVLTLAEDKGWITSGEAEKYVAIMPRIKITGTADDERDNNYYYHADPDDGSQITANINSYCPSYGLYAMSSSTWIAAEDTAVTGQARFENVRVRFSVKNTGGVASDYNYRLQVSDNQTSGYADVPLFSTPGTSVACMATSTQFTNQATATRQLSIPDSFIWAAGKMVEDTSNESDAITLNKDYFTEVEFNFQFTSVAQGSTTYYFRVVNSTTPLDSYTEVATIIIGAIPTWESYSDDTHETVCEDFDVFETEHWVYMHGEGFTADEYYKVIYWDGLGNKRVVDSSVQAGATGNLSSQHEFAVGDEIGDWHCTVYYPASCNKTSYSTTDSNIETDDVSYTGGYAFYMDEAAIPEFPTIISAIAAMGLCFGIYWWMRRRTKFKMQGAKIKNKD